MFPCTDCVCEMEAGSKSYPNCFTVGPVIDDGATRTFFISCCKCNNYYVCIKAHKLCLVCTCTYVLVLGGINFCSHDYCVKFNTVITILYTYYSMSIYTIKVKL